MSTLVFDIETVGENFSDLDDISRAYFERQVKTNEEREQVEASLALYPLTGQIVALAMMDAQEERGAVFYQNNGGPKMKSQQDHVVMITGNEVQLLTYFWKQVERYDQIVSFNGRAFDGPFIMLRSAIHKIQVTRNLVGYRYSPQWHVDLADQMTFYDAWRRRLPLHLWCRAFGIPSPKAGEVNGLMVPQLYREGHFEKIAEYCLQDVLATRELFQYWYKYLRG
jgi:predicted PolB exonuclease-like 3'-5' exonuclease